MASTKPDASTGTYPLRLTKLNSQVARTAARATYYSTPT